MRRNEQINFYDVEMGKDAISTFQKNKKENK